MAEKEENENFTKLLVKWYLKQKNAIRAPITSDQGEDNAKED